MSIREPKKSESIEVRVANDVKQALMTKAAAEGRSASDILRALMGDYVADNGRGARQWFRQFRMPVMAVSLGALALSAYAVSPAATMDRYEKAFREANARPLASKRVLMLPPYDASRTKEAFSLLDMDANGHLSFAEYARLLGIEADATGRSQFRKLDLDGDGRLSASEFRL